MRFSFGTNRKTCILFFVKINPVSSSDSTGNRPIANRQRVISSMPTPFLHTTRSGILRNTFSSLFFYRFFPMTLFGFQFITFVYSLVFITPYLSRFTSAHTCMRITYISILRRRFPKSRLYVVNFNNYTRSGIIDNYVRSVLSNDHVISITIQSYCFRTNRIRSFFFYRERKFTGYYRHSQKL